MALNKSQTTLGVKIVLIVVAIAMVGFLFPAVFDLFNRDNSNSANSQAGSGTTWDSIAAKYSAQVASNDQALQATPDSYALLVSQGNLYFDWALDVMNAAQTNQSLGGSDQPLWLSARQFYERAVAATQGIDPPVQTDLSIVYYYSGETTTAVGVVNKVIDIDPNFAPAWFNLGVFYSSQNETAKAISAFEKAVALDPNGQTTNVEYANQQIAALKGSSSATGTTSP